jgi:RNA methyltransferase, TrmH family
MMDWKKFVSIVERTRTSRGRSAMRRFAVEGLRLVERALASGSKIEAVLVAESFAGRSDDRSLRLLKRLDEADIDICWATDSDLSGVIDGREPGPILALIALPKPCDVCDVAPADGGVRLLVALDVDDPGNLGALARTALVGGADAFVVVGAGDPYHPRAVRISRGSLFKVPVVRIKTSEGLLDALNKCQIETVGAITHGGALPSQMVADPLARWAICMGSEAFGLTDDFIGELDHAVSIPMADGVDSYSVNAAAAILLYALGKQPRS